MGELQQMGTVTGTLRTNLELTKEQKYPCFLVVQTKPLHNQITAPVYLYAQSPKMHVADGTVFWYFPSSSDNDRKITLYSDLKQVPCPISKLNTDK